MPSALFFRQTVYKNGGQASAVAYFHPNTKNRPYPTHTKSSIESVFHSNIQSSGLPLVKAIKNIEAETMNKTQDNGDFAIDHDLMNFIHNTVRNAIEEGVQEVVDQELSLMINGDGFKKRVTYLIDARLNAFADEITIRTSGAGPGRGHRGRSHKKISLSLPESLYLKAKELEGFFSCHVAAALELYLRLQNKP